jgi:hypothetical protein
LAVALCFLLHLKERGNEKALSDIEDKKILQINALGKGFRPYRVLKDSKGSLAVFSHVTLYHFIGNKYI